MTCLATNPVCRGTCLTTAPCGSHSKQILIDKIWLQFFQVPGTCQVPGTLFQGLPVILRRAARFVITDKYDSVTLSRSLAQSAGRRSRRLSDEASH